MTNHPLTPDLTGYFQNKKFEIKNEINCISIGTVDSFDHSNQTVDLYINFLRVITSVGGKAPDTTLDYPILVKCPVVMLSGGDSSLTFPITKGDTCLVLFCDKDIDSWFTTGNIVAPNSQRVHDLNDAIALVGIRSMANVLANYNQLGPQLKNGLALVSVEERVKIEVGLLTLGAAMDTLMTALLTWVDTNDDTPSPGTIAALTAAKLQIDTVLK